MRARGIEPVPLTAFISRSDGIGEMGTAAIGTIEAVSMGFHRPNPFEKVILDSMHSYHVLRKGGTSWSF
jgi:hypothetical protein